MDGGYPSPLARKRKVPHLTGLIIPRIVAIRQVSGVAPCRERVPCSHASPFSVEKIDSFSLGIGSKAERARDPLVKK